jgi:DNA-binding CsgD family transcriptional regulator
VLRRGIEELTGDLVRRGPLLGSLVVVELARGDVEAARAAAGDLADLAGEGGLPELHARAERADAQVLATLGDRVAAVASMRSAKAHLDPDERPLLVGELRIELAELLAADEDAPGAIAEARAALTCFERLGAAPARDRASALLRSLGDTGRSRPQRASDVAAALTKREQEVLDLVAEGLSNAEIADRLYISKKTAEHHVGRVLTKLGVRSRAEAAALSVRLGVGAD